MARRARGRGSARSAPRRGRTRRARPRRGRRAGAVARSRVRPGATSRPPSGMASSQASGNCVDREGDGDPFESAPQRASGSAASPPRALDVGVAREQALPRAPAKSSSISTREHRSRGRDDVARERGAVAPSRCRARPAIARRQTEHAKRKQVSVRRADGREPVVVEQKRRVDARSRRCRSGRTNRSRGTSSKRREQTARRKARRVGRPRRRGRCARFWQCASSSAVGGDQRVQVERITPRGLDAYHRPSWLSRSRAWRTSEETRRSFTRFA